MKKILTLICCTAVLLATSCTKKYITPGTNNLTVIYNVAGTTGWSLSPDDNVSYQTTLGKDGDLPELDSNAQENGGVLVYLSFNDGTYEAIPETYNGVSYSYITQVGKIVIYAQGVNGTKLSAPPSDDVKVKVVLVDSAQ